MGRLKMTRWRLAYSSRSTAFKKCGFKECSRFSGMLLVHADKTSQVVACSTGGKPVSGPSQSRARPVLARAAQPHLAGAHPSIRVWAPEHARQPPMS